jgi:hypothetical protein
MHCYKVGDVVDNGINDDPDVIFLVMLCDFLLLSFASKLKEQTKYRWKERVVVCVMFIHEQDDHEDEDDHEQDLTRE